MGFLDEILLSSRMRGIPYSAGFQPYEAQARTLKTFEHCIVPGLFQTRKYA